jgi:hypothetical protein
MATAVAKLRGEPIDLRRYLCKWAEDAASQDALAFRCERYPEGERNTDAKREFAEREFTIDGTEIAWVESSIRHKATVVRPAVVSYFEVHTRGRVISLAPKVLAELNAESLCGASLGFRRFFLAISWRRGSCERTEKASRDPGYLIHRGEERGFV